MKCKIIKVKKLYNGCASIRDYVVQKCIDENKEIQVHYKNFMMSLTIGDLKNSFQFHKKKFESKYSELKYQLIDFKFRPDSLGK